MSFTHSFRDKPRLSDRIRGKSGDELFNELRKEFDQDRKSFFTTGRPSSPTSKPFGSSAGSTFPRTGHLFEDPSMRSHFDIKSHLEDLAQRHPEFADQLRYPAWGNNTSNSNSWGRKRRGSDHDSADVSKQQQQEPASTQPLPSEPEERGRPKDNLRNTVPDMGQKQQEAEDKESRGQRSWSAPPDNRAQQQEKPRFVSKIEITPVNPDAPPQTQTGDAAKPPMAPPKPQPQAQPQQQAPQQSQPKSNVRHIPIFVEGRDEPVLPKNIEPEFVQSQAPPPQQFSRPPQPQFQQQAPQRKQTPPHFEHHPPQPPPQPRAEPPPPQPEQTQPDGPTVNPRDPLYQVSCVQKEVDDLKSQIDSFSGNTRKDKQYILLDELLTRNLIKLDNVDTEGKEEVRAARKNAIKTIQRCISVLESKVPVPDSENADKQSEQENTMEVEQTGQERGASEGGDMNTTEKPMEVEPQVATSANTEDIKSDQPEKNEGAGDTNAKAAEESSENKSA